RRDGRSKVAEDSSSKSDREHGDQVRSWQRYDDDARTSGQRGSPGNGRGRASDKAQWGGRGERRPHRSRGGSDDRPERRGRREKRPGGQREPGRDRAWDSRDGRAGDRRPAGPRRDDRRGRDQRPAGRDRAPSDVNAPRSGRPYRGDRPRRDDRRQNRPGQEARADRPVEPRVPDSITGRELDRDVRSELFSLSRETAERVARHM